MGTGSLVHGPRIHPLCVFWILILAEETSGPVSRILYPGQAGLMIIPLGSALLPRSCDLPEGSNAPSRCVSRQAGTPSLFGLAPCGVYPALDIAAQAVRSYRTFSPLPPLARGGMFSVALAVFQP